MSTALALLGAFLAIAYAGVALTGLYDALTRWHVAGDDAA